MKIKKEKKLLESKKEYKITLDEFFSSKKHCAIHCETLKEAKLLLTAFNKVGVRWFDGKEYDPKSTRWKKFEERTCYSNCGYFGYPMLFRTVFEFSEVDISKYVSKKQKSNKKKNTIIDELEC